jgi:hypothetical protein
MTHVFKSPKYYAEMRKLQASSSKPRYTPTGILMVSCKDPKPEPSPGSSDNQDKLQAQSDKLQAPSRK